MKVFVSHDTALQYWRKHFPYDQEIGHALRVNPGESYAWKRDDVLGAYPELYVDQDQQIDVLVFDKSVRRYSQGIVCHQWIGDIPDNAFHCWKSLCVSSPEFVFLQMAYFWPPVLPVLLRDLYGRISMICRKEPGKLSLKLWAIIVKASLPYCSHPISWRKFSARIR